jgi:hypothetical protein
VKHKIGVIKRQVIEELWEIEIDAPTLEQAAANGLKAVDDGLMGEGKEDLIETTTILGTWDNGVWRELPPTEGATNE